METRSKYFTLSYLESSTTTTPEQGRQAADVAFSSIKTQLDDFNARLQVEISRCPERETNGYAVAKAKIIAEDLVFLTRRLPHHLALNILIECLSEPLFQEHDASHAILEGITKQNYQRSPLITGELSLDFIIKFQQTNSNDVENFLATPDLLLMWLEKASALEISKLFQQFFLPNSKYHELIRALAVKEFSDGTPGKALLCYTLMSPTRLSKDGAAESAKALEWLSEYEPRNNHERIALSVRVCMLANKEAIIAAKDCYINLNKTLLPNTNLASLPLSGASFQSAKLNNCDFSDADLTGTQFDHATLTGANFSGAKLADSSFRSADLKHAIFFSHEHLATPAAFKAELSRLHAMMNDHKQEAMLRAVIIDSLIASTRDSLSVKILQTAYDHPFCNKHKDMYVVKVGFNLALSAYNSFFKPAKVESYETDEQKTLRDEIEHRNKLLTPNSAPTLTSPH